MPATPRREPPGGVDRSTILKPLLVVGVGLLAALVGLAIGRWWAGGLPVPRVSRDNAAVWAAFVAAMISLFTTSLSVISNQRIPRRLEADRQRFALAMADIEAQRVSQRERRDLLRSVLVTFVDLATREASLASQLVPGEGDEALRREIVECHPKLRSAYVQLCLCLTRQQTQTAARLVLRAAYNYRQKALGRPLRRHLPEGHSPVSVMRLLVTDLQAEARLELGIEESLRWGLDDEEALAAAVDEFKAALLQRDLDDASASDA